MNRYLVLTKDDWGFQYTTVKNNWMDALADFYKYIDNGQLSPEDFELLIKNKVAKEAINLFNQMINDSEDEIAFFGIIKEPFVSDFTFIEIEGEKK